MLDTICAIATSFGTSAISIIRCSGPDAINYVNKVFKGKDLTKVKGYTIHHGYIMDNDDIVDEVLVNVYLKPNSYDGENDVEINCHGGIYVTNKVMDVLLKNGFRLATNGEFSKRAFLNGKMDLTKAEAVMDVISSSSDLSLKASLSSLRGKVSKLIQNLRDNLLDIIAKIEVNIDYPEYEDAPDVTHDYLYPILSNIKKEMEEILDNSKTSTIVIHGIKTSIVGKPNVGKSSLLNMLLDEERAIVTDIPGTTRDTVEGTLKFKNMTLNLIDTAGIRESDDIVEAIGIKRSQKAIDESDICLLVLDPSRPLEDIDKELLKLTENKKRIIISNKDDLEACFHFDDEIRISCKKKEGANLVLSKIEEVMKISSFNPDNDKYLCNIRQTDLLNKSYQSLCDAMKGLDLKNDISLIEIDMRQAFDYLGEIIGESSPDELVTALFTKFCLGK